MYSAVIVAAGKGTRANLTYNKVFHEIKGKHLIEFTIRHFINDESCVKIIVVVSIQEFDFTKKLLTSPKIEVILGGTTRQESVYLGLKQVSTEIVLIHDGARPNIKPEFIESVLNELSRSRAVTLAIPVKDTLNIVKNNIIESTIDRSTTFQIQTPQGFYLTDIQKAHEEAYKHHHEYTDDASLYMNEIQLDVSVVLGDETNLKATTQIDLLILEELL
ncbi:MAG: 2-C-methyl-D-erythritol 4-phosphate cytidylyltransferase [Candidatus Izemoplasmatales bacterium]|nr:2-C-methyl-D-erythritol 4-phosphate cytidylyltransferase [Candidatus Izemoplasmatales bacterium]